MLVERARTNHLQENKNQHTKMTETNTAITIAREGPVAVLPDHPRDFGIFHCESQWQPQEIAASPEDFIEGLRFLQSYGFRRLLVTSDTFNRFDSTVDDTLARVEVELGIPVVRAYGEDAGEEQIQRWARAFLDAKERGTI